MAIDARILSQGAFVPSIARSINIFDQAVQAGEARKARAEQAEREKALAPLRQQQLEQTVDMQQQQIDEQKENRIIRSVAEFAPVLRPALEAAIQSGDTAQAQTLLTQRLIDLQNKGVDTTETVEAITQLRQGNPQQVLANLNAIDAAATQRGLVRTTPKVTGTASQRDFQTFQELQAKANATGKQEDIDKARQFGAQSGFIRTTDQEKADIRVDEAGRKETAKSISSRKQGFIDSGVEAADSVRNIKRSLELLESVSTGGFDNAKFRIKQFFGVEGADEGELSANLGTSVLAQLKPIFGAAFTAAEGQRLERISARFGANPETNKRLLNEALRIAERAANRGIKAAEDSEDFFTAEEIKKSLEFIDEVPAGPAPEVSAEPQPQPSAVEFQEGMTATGPNGEKATFKNGQWVIING